MEVNIHETESQPPLLIESPTPGEGIVIAKEGNPVVRLAGIDQGKPFLGAATGQFPLPEGWDAALADDEVEELFGQ